MCLDVFVLLILQFDSVDLVRVLIAHFEQYPNK